MLVDIGEFLGVVYFWMKLNIQAILNKGEYVKFSKLWKGRDYPLNKQADGRPYRNVGIAIFFIFMFIVVIRSCIVYGIK